MAQNDIYNSKGRYERFVEEYIKKEKILEEPKDPRRKYHCKNKVNLKYYHKIIRCFEVDDLSYVRRIRLLDLMNLLTFIIECDLKNANSIEKEGVILKIREVTTYSQLRKTQVDIRRIGRLLFEETERPSFFKEFKLKTDISRQEARKDKLTIDEFQMILGFFSKDSVMQGYLSLAFESLARPQELMYLKIGNIEWNNEYAVIHVSSYTKEGIKKLLSIESFPYLLRLYQEHPSKKNEDSFLFLNEYGNQLTPGLVNKKLRIACNKLGIDKPITPYSLKRFGVTFRRLRGDSDVQIQRIAGWRSTEQLRTYDLSDQEDVFKVELAKKGLIKDEKLKHELPQTKRCVYCNELVGFAESICPKCSHIQDQSLIKKQQAKDELIELLLDMPKEELLAFYAKRLEAKPEIIEKLRYLRKS